MTLHGDADDQLRAFLAASRFASAGAVMTDLDGTAVHEFEGRIVIPEPVEFGLKRLHDLGRRVVLNTLRFPRNVIRTFGREWYSVTNGPLPLVSLNGSVVGNLVETPAGEIGFEEIAAFPLAASEIEEVLVGVRGLVEGGIEELLLFYYPRDWRVGEIIWTPSRERVAGAVKKYRSATQVVATGLDELRDRLLAQDICMVFLLVEAPEDRLMAYQHAKRSNFVTRKGVDKLYGAERAAEALGVELAESVGAGDTPMDSFLKGVGLAIQVGPLDLEYRGLRDTVKVPDSRALGDLLFRLADMQRGA